LVAEGFLGVAAASEDASKIYLVSTKELAGGSIAGKPNLYLYEAGQPGNFTFVATLSGSDVTGDNERPSIVATAPIKHVAAVTPDGTALAFMSSASLTGYDNTDAVSSEADSEVFLYRAGPATLACVSCLGSGARPMGRNIEKEIHIFKVFWAAAQFPAAQSQLHFPHVLSDDGSRLFFESFDPLVLRDVNSQKDVYEWELLGTGNCTETAPGFTAAVGGCINLISSGESPQSSEIVDASADGRDMFFKTASSLLPQDPELIDIYDARVGGGFPLAEPAPPECEGEACQQPASPLNDPTPSSRTFVGPGNPVAKPKHHRRRHKKRHHRVSR
jgi:hypothetical protein